MGVKSSCITDLVYMPIIELVVVHVQVQGQQHLQHKSDFFLKYKLISIFHFKIKIIAKHSLLPFVAILLGHSTIFMSFTNVIIHVAIAR